MKYTIAEKVLSIKSGIKAKAGKTVVANIDVCMATDASGSLTIDVYNEIKINKNNTNDIKKIFVFDHYVPSPNDKVSKLHDKIRIFCKKENCILIDVGEGIGHQILPEKGYIIPGDLIIGADSHSCTYGALNAFGTGVGSTDLATSMTTGKLWFDVPETIKINLNGQLNKGVYAKDLALYIIGILGASGANYNSLEFHGESIKNLSISDRLTVCNMMVESGAMCSLMPYDNITKSWFEDNNIVISDCGPLSPDKGAFYIKTVDIDLNEISPQIAKPHKVDNVTPIKNVEGKKIDMVFIGTCTNGRYSDLKIVSNILEKHNIHPNVKVLIAPASREILKKLIRSGIISNLTQKGIIILPPSCGPCCGSSPGVPGDQQNVLSTANRNFKGRMGNPKSNIFLGSPASAISSAICGEIKDPREFIR